MKILDKTKRLVLSTLKYVSLIIAAFIAILPVVSMVITSLKTPEEYASTNVMTMPENWLNFDNFTYAWETANMSKAFLNTTIILVVVLTLSILFSAMLAYVLSRFKFPGNGLIRNLFLFAALIPGVTMQVTTYQIMNSLNLINSLPGYIVLMLGTDIVTVYLFIQFFENIPTSLDEAAILAGANYFQIFFKVLLPLTKPAIITTAILKGVGTYNEYYMADLYLQDKTQYVTVATSLYTFTGPLGSEYNYISAGVIITIIPALIIFLLFQKQIYSGLTTGAVKG